MSQITTKYKDQVVLEIVDKYPSAAFVWYLQSAYAYHVLGRPIITDSVFDELEKKVLFDWNKITSPFKKHVKFEEVRAGSSFIDFTTLPKVVRTAAEGQVRNVYGLKTATSPLNLVLPKEPENKTDSVKVFNSKKTSSSDGTIQALVLGNDTSVTRFMNSIPYIYAINGDGLKENLDEFDMIVFTGGADINPEYYGEKNKLSSWLNKTRDEVEFSVFYKTRHTHYHFGICRGLQLLAVANGVPLWQDIRGHACSPHHMKVVPGAGEWAGKVIQGVTSAHHQALRITEGNEHRVLAYTEFTDPVTAMRVTDLQTVSVPLQRVVEAAWFEGTKCFGVQGHPEYDSASQDFRRFVEHHLIDDIETGFYANLSTGDRQCAG